MKMRCDCKGAFKEEVRNFEGLQSEACVCQKCGYVTLTMKQAGKLLKLKEIRDWFRRGRKTIKIGNAVGITLPKEFVGKEGRPVEITPLDIHTLKIRLG